MRRAEALKRSDPAVLGVIADARTESLQDPVPVIYASAYQKAGNKHLAIFLRGHVDTPAMRDWIREQVQLVDATLPVFGSQMLGEAVAASLTERRFSMEVIGLFAVTALLLSALGIYGVISHLVTERTREIGIRLALGANRRTILEMLIGQCLALTTLGLCVGLAGAAAVARLMAGTLYGVRPTDPLTFLSVAGVLAIVALLACYIPARRAMRVDPMTTLRQE